MQITKNVFQVYNIVIESKIWTSKIKRLNLLFNQKMQSVKVNLVPWNLSGLVISI